MEITIASWNIWIDGPRDAKGIAKVIKDNKIDIIGIQEAGIYYDTKPPQNIAEEVARELDFNFVFYPACDSRPDKQFVMGNAIISRFPIVKSLSYRLSPFPLKYSWKTGKYGEQPKILVASKIKLFSDKVINFLTTHLQFSVKFKLIKTRTNEVKKVFSIIKKLKDPIILTGDFNGYEIKIIEEILTRVDGNEPTWTVHPGYHWDWWVDELKYRFDNIYISKDLSCKDFEIIDSKLSDHLPIKATIIL